MVNGLGIDAAQRIVTIQGIDLILRLFEGVSNCDMDYFSKIAFNLVKAKAVEFGITDIGRPHEWSLACSNEPDYDLLMSYLKPEVSMAVQVAQSLPLGEPLADQTYPVKTQEVTKKWLN